MNDPIQQKIVEDSIRQEIEQTLSCRAVRYLQVKPHSIIPYTHFAATSAECSLLFRDGYFYGCIALTQSVAEVLVRFLCQRNSWSPAENFEENIHKLTERGFISDKAKQSFLKIWEQRDDYHHLNPDIETDRHALEDLAKSKIGLLNEIEKEVFSFTVTNDGKIMPKQPKYWKGIVVK